MIDFLLHYMLKGKPIDRQSAAECLNAAIEISLFDESLIRTGSLTPDTHQASLPFTSMQKMLQPSEYLSGRTLTQRTVTTDVHCDDQADSVRSALERTACLEMHSNRSGKKRRTTHDFDPGLSFPDFTWPLDGDLLYRAASNSSHEEWPGNVDRTGSSAPVPTKGHFSSLRFHGQTIFHRDGDG